ncbi:MAG: hypothetical protein QM523_07365 [Candidatus Pacebacteria bacterium]|nr:hypothetical protein [Candidatus Paceibacterota bacterium]
MNVTLPKVSGNVNDIFNYQNQSKSMEETGLKTKARKPRAKLLRQTKGDAMSHNHFWTFCGILAVILVAAFGFVMHQIESVDEKVTRLDTRIDSVEASLHEIKGQLQILISKK